jgi:hypothetical protein
VRQPRGIVLLSLLILASLFVGISCWAAIVPRLTAGTGPKTWFEWLAVLVLSGLPISIPPALIGLWQRAGWAPGTVLAWGALLVGELALTIAAAGSLAGLSGPEWFVPWTAVVGAAFALGALVRYVRRVSRPGNAGPAQGPP